MPYEDPITDISIHCGHANVSDIERATLCLSLAWLIAIVGRQLYLKKRTACVR